MRQSVTSICIANAFIFLGYTYFWFEEVRPAIENTEHALVLLEGSSDEMIYICRANLAYYYAESLTRIDRRSSEDAVLHIGDQAHCVDTRGYVRMRFGQDSIAELTKARDDFLKASQSDPSLSAAYRHLAEVDARLKHLRNAQK